MEKRPRLLIFVGALFIVGLIVAGYWFQWGWTGFTEHASSTKTFWDWLQLLGVLAIPAVIGIGAWSFTTKHVQVREAETTDNQREAALQEYINKMLELLLVNDLRHSSEDDEVRWIARVRTITVLRKLDPVRKASVLQFLQETDLVNKDQHVVELVEVDLSGAKLSGINLSGVMLCRANLNGANLSGANLSGANLRGATLSGANLSGATLSGANLSEADLSDIDLSTVNLSDANLSNAKLSGSDLGGADLRGANGVTDEQLNEAKSLEGAVMPDGSKHS